MSYLFKAFLKIILRLFKLIESQLSRSKFSFRDALGTRDAVQVLFIACFIAYKNAFDSARHEKVMEILKRVGVPDPELQIIANLY